MTFLLANWKLVLIGLLILSTGFFFKLWREEVRAFAVFKAQVEVLGKAAQVEKERIEREHKLLKERTDVENKRTTANLRATITRLRNDPGQGGLSSPTPSPASPDRTCFDPAALDRALRNLNQDLLGLIEEGSQAVIDLDSAKAWARGVGFPVK